FTPSFFNQNTTSNYQGNLLKDSKANFNFGNAGIVLSYYDEGKKSDWKGLVFGFGYNRLNNFNNQIAIKGKNDNNSLLDVYLADANSNGKNVDSYDQFGTRLAWDTYLLDTTSAGVYYHVLPQFGETQEKTITSSGSKGEAVFSFGGNYSDKLFLGATIGVPHIHYYETSSYSEKADTSGLNSFKSFQLDQNLTTTGKGINFKFGMIYRPLDWIRIGGAIHSPSYFNMHDDYSSNMTSHVYGTTYTAQSPAGSFDYTLTTPMKAIGSIGFVINKMGLINADYEYVDYSTASMHSSNYSFLTENMAIHQKYTMANNFRIGTEWRLAPMSIRGGVAFYGSPFKQGVGNDGSRISYTGGLGFREENFFVDFAYVLTVLNENYYLYDPTSTGVSPSANTSKMSSVMMTVGFKF
ncbi:MAG TPA: outer membrane protein transport protein, partial [Bacteroidia bacterium]